MPTFSDFIRDLEAEAKTEGPAAVAELEAYRQHFRLLAELADRRKALRLSQAELARAAGLYQSDVSNFERGRGNPSVHVTERIATAMGMELRVLPLRSTRMARASLVAKSKKASHHAKRRASV